MRQPLKAIVISTIVGVLILGTVFTWMYAVDHACQGPPMSGKPGVCE
jgi:uncharacterized MnhB-related membrane protein